MLCIRPASSGADWDHAAAMLHDYVAWMRAAGIEPFTEQPAFADELAALEQHYTVEHRSLLLASNDGAAVGTIALWRHRDATAELKRMYVVPSARGSGVADGLVATALDVAIGHRCRAVWLETVKGPMDRAITLYRRHGFAETRPAPRWRARAWW